MSDPEINQFIRSLDPPLGFDPADKLRLSDEMRERMEQFAIAIKKLKNPGGLYIRFEMDWWLIAQMVDALYKGDGSPKTIAETIDL